MPAILGPTENQVFDPSYLKARKSPAQTNAGTSDSTMGLCHRCHMCRMCRMCHNTKTPLALHNTFITLDIDIGRYRSRSDTDTPPAILITFFCGNRSFQSWLISSATAALASKAGTWSWAQQMEIWQVSCNLSRHLHQIHGWLSNLTYHHPSSSSSSSSMITQRSFNFRPP